MTFFFFAKYARLIVITLLESSSSCIFFVLFQCKTFVTTRNCHSTPCGSVRGSQGGLKNESSVGFIRAEQVCGAEWFTMCCPRFYRGPSSTPAPQRWSFAPSLINLWFCRPSLLYVCKSCQRKKEARTLLRTRVHEAKIIFLKRSHIMRIFITPKLQWSTFALLFTPLTPLKMKKK